MTGLKTKTVNAKIIEFECLGVKREALLIIPYGLMSNAPDDSFVISFAQDGNDDSQICYTADIENIDELENTEVAIGVPTLKARIKFDQDGNIIIKGEDEKAKITIDKDGNIIILGHDESSEIKLDINGKLTGTIKDVFEIEDGNGNTIKSNAGGYIDVNGNSKKFVTYTELNTALQLMVTAANNLYLTSADNGVAGGGLTLNISASESTKARTG